MKEEKISRYFLPQSPGAGPSTTSDANLTSSPPSRNSHLESKPVPDDSTLDSLRSEWKTLYSITLPSLAKSNAPSQPTWPVHLDHCFARIILDNVVGIDTPWTEKIMSPAWKNMGEKDLKGALKMGRGIMEGKEDLVRLDERSLELRGKSKGKGKGKSSLKAGSGGIKSGVESMAKKKPDQNLSSSEKKPTKRKAVDLTSVSDEPEPAQPLHPLPPTKKLKSHHEAPPSSDSDNTTFILPPPITPILLKLSTHPSLSPFRKLVLSHICLIPPSHFSTYASLSTYLHSSPRAVGTALRNNPFPGIREGEDVPCHRILAAKGEIGGFGGEWGKGTGGGEKVEEKRRRLRGEGVRFDVKGRAVGRPWDGWGRVVEKMQREWETKQEDGKSKSGG